MTAPVHDGGKRRSINRNWATDVLHEAAAIEILRRKPCRKSQLRPAAELASLLLIDLAMTVLLLLLPPIRATLFKVLVPMGLGSGLSAWTGANLLFQRAGIIGAERRPTLSGQVCSEFDTGMVICKNEPTSIYGLFGLQEPSDMLHTGESTLSETTLSEPICLAVLSQECITAVSQLLHLQASTG